MITAVNNFTIVIRILTAKDIIIIFSLIALIDIMVEII